MSATQRFGITLLVTHPHRFHEREHAAIPLDVARRSPVEIGELLAAIRGYSPGARLWSLHPVVIDWFLREHETILVASAGGEELVDCYLRNEGWTRAGLLSGRFILDNYLEKKCN